jgi:hypothetical protein
MVTNQVRLCRLQATPFFFASTNLCGQFEHAWHKALSIPKCFLNIMQHLNVLDSAAAGSKVGQYQLQAH